MIVDKYGIEIKRSNVEDNIVDMTCNGKCSKCGNCCSLFIPFTDRELNRIRKYVRKHNIMPQNRNTEDGFLSQCCFLDRENHLCTIYPVRPYVCSDFICSRKNWKVKRDEYESKAIYNSTKSRKFIMATFDDKVFKDYYPIMRHILEACKNESGLVDSSKLMATIRIINREDLLEQFSAEDESGKEYKGTELKSLE